MWVVEKYVKYLIGFAILWFGLVFYRSCGCAKVHGAYMAPTYLSDSFLVIYAGKNRPGVVQVKDVVWFWYKELNAPDDGHLARVVGLPGEPVAIKKGEIFIRGVALPEEYLKADSNDVRWNLPEIVVPRDTYFLLCDSRRDAGPDSRRFGPIPVNAVWGKVRK